MPYGPFFADYTFAGTARRAAYVPNPGLRLKPVVHNGRPRKKPGSWPGFSL